MDPASLGNYEWTEIGKLLINLWVIVVLVVSFAGNMIVGHIFIPSLVASHHIPAVSQRARPAFYALAVVSIAAAFYVLYLVIGLSDVIDRVYADYWI